MIFHQKFFVPSHMEHIRKASTEGWLKLAMAVFVLSVLSWLIFVLDLLVIMRVIFLSILVSITVIAIAYAIANIRNKGTFVCKLTETDFSQTSPMPPAGQSFQIKLAEITQIEIHRTAGESSQDQYFLYTDQDRYQISNNYGNPAGKFVEAIQKALPRIKTIQT